MQIWLTTDKLPKIKKQIQTEKYCQTKVSKNDSDSVKAVWSLNVSQPSNANAATNPGRWKSKKASP